MTSTAPKSWAISPPWDCRFMAMRWHGFRPSHGFTRSSRRCAQPRRDGMRRETLMARTSKTFSVTIRNSGQMIACAADRTILAAAIAAGVDYPYACATGNCATCISTLTSGEVDMLPYGDGALSTFRSDVPGGAVRRGRRVPGCMRHRQLRHVHLDAHMGRG